MFRTQILRIAICFVLVTIGTTAFPQTESATITGRVADASHAVVKDAEIEISSVERGTVAHTVTNASGIYFFPAVRPGQYNISARHEGFRRIDALNLTVNVQDHVVENFVLQVGSAIESVTVNAETPLVNTQDATVSTIVDRNFADNLPMNGRTFQSLIELVPGVLLLPTNGPTSGADGGQFSVNGQRGTSNYWMIDGVSANVGISASTVAQPGQGMGGALGAVTAQGGTNGLVSVDALQEFRIDTSTFLPEFGRTPGAQISIVTRSGTNQFHGELFDYLRNDLLDANDWFADRDKLKKPEERQNDFGGTFGGPIFHDRTFFFFSYEGLRLRLPEVLSTTVPDLSSRQSASSPAVAAILNAFPLPDPKLPDDTGTGVGGFNASFSSKSTLDAYSLRLDHRLASNINVFGRYNYSPSEIVQRSGNGAEAVSDLQTSKVEIQTATAGGSWLVSPNLETELRFNFSRTAYFSRWSMDNFGGATPLTSVPLPSPYTLANSFFNADIVGLTNCCIQVGNIAVNTQKQINLVDTWSLQRGLHSLKFGVDYRRLTPSFGPAPYSQQFFFPNTLSAAQGQTEFALIVDSRGGTPLLRNLSFFAQDNWRARGRLSVAYGVRWDVDFGPSSVAGPSFAALQNFDLSNLSKATLAPTGTPAFNTRYVNLAPRLGLAYQVHQSPAWSTVLRGGYGLFYDLATAEAGNLISADHYPFGNFSFPIGATYPLSAAQAAPPPIVPPNPNNQGSIFAFNPNLKSPYTLQWNATVDQGLGNQQSLSVSYVGARGRQLIGSAFVLGLSNFGSGQFVLNGGTSDYNALQLQFQRRLVKGLQVLSSYTWAHSIDTGSTGSLDSLEVTPEQSIQANRGPSDFDIRNAFSAGVTYSLPRVSEHAYLYKLTDGWSLQSIVHAWSAPPVDIFNPFVNLQDNTGGAELSIRPDVAPGVPLYLYGAQFPGGKAINNTPGVVTCSDGTPSVGPFCTPPVDPNTGAVLRQGTLGRNTLRGFGAAQWDFGVHRTFPIREQLSLEFRSEFFNILNHPNFGQPQNLIGFPNFGVSTQMLGSSLSGTPGGGGLSSEYQIGGPRSVQFALKLRF